MPEDFPPLDQTKPQTLLIPSSKVKNHGFPREIYRDKDKNMDSLHKFTGIGIKMWIPCPNQRNKHKNIDCLHKLIWIGIKTWIAYTNLQGLE